MRFHCASVCLVAVVGCLAFSPSSRAQEPNQPQQPAVYQGPVGGSWVIEEGQPRVMIHATTEQMKQFREANPNARPGSVQAASTANDLFYHGGTGGIGVETAPKVYLVLWGSQWNNKVSLTTILFPRYALNQHVDLVLRPDRRSLSRRTLFQSSHICTRVSAL